MLKALLCAKFNVWTTPFNIVNDLREFLPNLVLIIYYKNWIPNICKIIYSKRTCFFVISYFNKNIIIHLIPGIYYKSYYKLINSQNKLNFWLTLRGELADIISLGQMLKWNDFLTIYKYDTQNNYSRFLYGVLFGTDVYVNF